MLITGISDTVRDIRVWLNRHNIVPFGGLYKNNESKKSILENNLKKVKIGILGMYL